MSETKTYTIRHRYTNAVLFETEASSLAEAVSKATKAGAYLADADLADADLAGADLAGANLAGAYLAGAYLAGAYLADADLADADLADADLAGAYRSRNPPAGWLLDDSNRLERDPNAAPIEPTAPPKRAKTPEERKALRAERAQRYRDLHPEVPVVERLDARILEAITTGGGKLDMGTWHSCETTHCRAGWAIVLAGKAGRELEDRHGPQRAGAMIYRASTGRVPHFFALDAVALEDIKRCAEESAAP